MSHTTTDRTRFTVDGSLALERRIGRIVANFGQAVSAAVDPSLVRSMILIGGYGRGEGGVEALGSRHACPCGCVPGDERPHNNLDFLLILEDRGRRREAEIRKLLFSVAATVGKVNRIGIDVSTTTVGRLRRAPCLVIWYDMRFGHRPVLGDADFVPSLNRFSVDRILPGDVRELMVNRGTLLVINDHLRRSRPIIGETRRAIVRHAVKAVIGYGDALLFQLGAYHWSYVEKRRRMRQQTEVPEGFRALYEEAAGFRLRPDYERFPSFELETWLGSVRSELESVHLRCEALRLKRPDLSWSNYLATALAASIGEDWRVPQRLVRKALSLATGPRYPWASSIREELGFRCAGPRGLQSLAFPVVAYDLDNSSYRATAQRILGCDDGSPDALRRAYLELWGQWKDINLTGSLKRLGASLQEAA